MYGVNEYNQVQLSSEVLAASPSQLITILFENALKQITSAKFSLQENNIVEKCKALSKAIEIVSYLRSCLNFKAAPELAEHLDRIYDFVERHLAKANAKNDVAMLDEAYNVLANIKDGWEGIPYQVSEG